MDKGVGDTVFYKDSNSVRCFGYATTMNSRTSIPSYSELSLNVPVLMNRSNPDLFNPFQFL